LGAGLPGCYPEQSFYRAVGKKEAVFMESEMIAALAILVGGFLIFLDRRRKRRQSEGYLVG
jgi:hypothetical protein